jgi:hypothetical protein
MVNSHSPQVQSTAQTGGAIKTSGWAKEVAAAVEGDQRQQHWKNTFKNEKVNDKVTKSPDLAVYSSAIPQSNGLTA